MTHLYSIARVMVAATMVALPLPTLAATMYVDGQIGSSSCTTYSQTSRTCSGGTDRGYKTIAGANAAALAGDTVVIRSGTYTDAISPARSGSSDLQRIVYQRYANEQPTLTAKPAVSLTGRSYITVDGITATISNCSSICFVLLSNSHHITIQHSVMQHDSTPQSGSWPEGVVFVNSSHHNILFDNTISGGGYATSNDDIGDLIGIGDPGSGTNNDPSNYNLIDSNRLSRGGHHILGLGSSFNIVRNNYLHNEEWTPCPRTQTGGLCGNRLIITDVNGQFVNNNIIEDNVLAFSGLPPDDEGSSGASIRTPSNIVRRNVFIDNDEAGLTLTSIDYFAHDLRFNHIYNNTFFHNGYAAFNTFTPFNSGLYFARFGNTTPITQVTVKNNIFWKNSAGSITYYDDQHTNGTDPAQQIVVGNMADPTNPLFVNDTGVLDPLHPENINLHLKAGSPAIDKGLFLTTTTSAGSGTTIPVVDAGFFTNGFGVIAGDVIQLQGQVTKATVTAVDTTANTITVDTALTWTAGLGVSLPYNGTAPDVGAFEFSTNAPPAAPTNLRISGLP